MQVLYRSLLTLILSHAHGDALPARVGAALEAELFKVCLSPVDMHTIHCHSRSVPRVQCVGAAVAFHA